ncbi:hypothetical protein METHP14_140035 [Pseudomonas sp. P14-2025]
MSQAVEPTPQCPVQQLTRNGLRKDDPLDQLLLPVRKPVYILLQDHERAQRLAQQLEFFGLVVQALPSAAAFLASISEYPPSAIIMDVDFTGAGLGLLLAAQVQQGLARSIPLLFFSHHEADTPTRLARSTRRRSGLSHRQPGSLQLAGKGRTADQHRPARPVARADHRRFAHPGHVHRACTGRRRHAHPQPDRPDPHHGRACRLPARPDHPRPVHAGLHRPGAGQGNPPQ